MGFTDDRRKYQLAFLRKGEEIVVGNRENLPLRLEELMKIDENSGYVEQVFSSGLTAYVYKLNIDGQFYTLKRKRPEILVKNIDGQTSFLNEVQRRSDFEKLKKRHIEKFECVVDTVYASLKNEIILSKWIEGSFITQFSPSIFESIYSTLLEVEKGGLFECDLSSPNLLVDDENKVHFFDFGYMYPFNPLKHYNSDGTENPIFHTAERLESRFLMQYLLDIERNEGIETVLAHYRIAKEASLKFYLKKMHWLRTYNAQKNIIDWQTNYITLWENGLKSDACLLNVYELEAYRSYLLDVHDDLSGKSCTAATLQKADKIIQKLEDNYDFLKNNNGLFWGDENMEKEQLLKKYQTWKRKAISYQLK